jgi:hypothetical protein
MSIQYIAGLYYNTKVLWHKARPAFQRRYLFFYSSFLGRSTHLDHNAGVRSTSLGLRADAKPKNEMSAGAKDNSAINVTESSIITNNLGMRNEMR